MDSLNHLRDVIRQVFMSWEELAKQGIGFHVVTFLDTQNDRYLLQQVQTTGERYQSQTLAHLEIRDNKIWILTDNTEQGIATELVAAGLEKSQIVLGFYPPRVRLRGEFAAA
ncbi:element excision factor XisI family protein [Armatimonas sp.]|uniref:element excision factor XisI family protein n=1 Tax=Armatimonas sp. TaxID=1872638 RepID=UPI0037528DF3